jgi:hypothetical protein
MNKIIIIFLLLLIAAPVYPMQPITRYLEAETVVYQGLSGSSGTQFTINESIKTIKFDSGLTLPTVGLKISAATNLFITGVTYTSTGLPINDLRWIPQGTTKITLSDGTNSATMRAVSAGSAEVLSATELLTNPNFATDLSGWTPTTTGGTGTIVWSSTNNVLFTQAGTSVSMWLSQSVATTANALYKAQITGISCTAGQANNRIYLGTAQNGGQIGNTASFANVTQSLYGTAAGTTTWFNFRWNAVVPTYTNVGSATLKNITAPDASGLVFNNLTLGSLNVNAASYSIKLEKW